MCGLSFEASDGDFVNVMGQSGCGKTTLLKCLAGVEPLTSGELYCDDEVLNNVAVQQRNVALVSQEFSLFPNMTVFENVLFALKKQRGTYDEKCAVVWEILRKTGLEDIQNAFPKELSYGQRQKTAIARALVRRPKIMLFDEPLSNLDAKLRVTMRTEIRRIQQEAGITAIYVTHDQSEAMALSDQIIIMEKGDVRQIGTPQEIYYHPANEFVADFIGEANFLRGELTAKNGDQGTVEIEGSPVDVIGVRDIEEKKQCTLVLRPESAVLAEQGQLPCRVILSCFMGAYQNYHVMVGDTMVKITDFNPKNKKIYQVGDTAYVAFEKENVHVL